MGRRPNRPSSGPDPEAVAELQARWRREPLSFFSEALGLQLWEPKQKEIVESFATNYLTAIVSANGTGKTKVAAGCGLLWMLSRPNSILVTSAPTVTIGAHIWREMRELARELKRRIPAFDLFTDPSNSGYGFSPSAPYLKLDSLWYATQVISTQDKNAYSGFHAPGGVAYIIDEAAGVPNFVFEAARLCATAPARDRIVCLGNPVCDANAEFYRLAKKADVPERHRTIHISAFDTPNIKLGYEVVPGMNTREWVEEQKATYGEDSDVYRQSVLGEFAEIGSRSLITPSIIQIARNRFSIERFEPDPTDDEATLGLDPGRYSDPASLVIRPKGGGPPVFPTLGMVRDGRIYPIAGQPLDGPTIARETLAVCKEMGVYIINIDETGLGASTLDALNDIIDRGEAGVAVEIHSNNFGAGATTNKHASRRVELWDATKDYLRTRGTLNADCPVTTRYLMTELTAPQYSIRGGRIWMEEKDLVRKRIRRSPDLADAYCLAVWGHHGKHNRGVKPWVEFI